jgi:hypothetical protein
MYYLKKLHDLLNRSYDLSIWDDLISCHVIGCNKLVTKNSVY